MRVASCVVGPLAASATILALIFGALSAVIWFAKAAGTKISQSISKSSSFVIRSSNSGVIRPCSFLSSSK